MKTIYKLPKKWHKNKYHAQKQTIDGIKFDSKAEANYYMQNIKNKENNFTVHEKFEITPRFKVGQKVKRKRVYSPDFAIFDSYGHLKKVVDVKPKKITTDASLRMNLFEYQYEIPITIARYDYRNQYFDEEEF